MPIPVPWAPDQDRIVEMYERDTSVVAALETELDSALERSRSLRQTVLRDAFSGRLVLAPEVGAT